MVENREAVPGSKHSIILKKTGWIVIWILIVFTVLCLLSGNIYDFDDDVFLWWLATAFGIAVLVIAIFTKCCRLTGPLLLVSFLIGGSALSFVVELIDPKSLTGATRTGDIRAMKRRIAQGANVNGIEDNGLTMLTSACSYWRRGGPRSFERQQTKICEMVEILIDNGADVNLLDNWRGRGPLHVAIRRKMSRVVELLLAKGADPNLKDREGNIPLHSAMARHLSPDGTVKATEEIVRLLVAKGADVNAKNDQGVTPLTSARGSLLDGVAEILRKHGAKE